MRHYPVESSTVLSVGYDPATEVLEVVFHAAPTTVYSYKGVTADAVVEMMFAESVGAAHAALIRGRPYTKEKH